MIIVLPDRPQRLQAGVGVGLGEIQVEGDDAGMGFPQKVNGLGKVAAWKRPPAQHILALFINGHNDHRRSRCARPAQLESDVERFQFNILRGIGGKDWSGDGYRLTNRASD